MVVQVRIDSLIGHSAMEYRKCIGYKVRGGPCTNANALKDVKEASEYTEAASLLRCSTSEGRSDLQWLAALLLCRHNHQEHSYAVMETWQNQALQCLSVESTACTREEQEKQSPPSKNISLKEKDDSHQKCGDASDDSQGVRSVQTDVQTRSTTRRAARKSTEDVEQNVESRAASDVSERVRSVQSYVQTRSTTRRAVRQCPEDIEEDREVLEGENQVDKIKTNVQTRSMTARTSRTLPQRLQSPPEFVEYRKSKRDLTAVNAELMKHILNESPSKPNRCLTENDLKPGRIYAFTRESSPGYVKIGLTKREIAVRLSEFRRQCRYSPHQETLKHEKVIPYVAQIERLIHAELALHRRRESLCNGGVGCPKVHHEWVQVELSSALEVIDRWCSWAERLPYDSDGVLRDEWKAHTKVPVRPASGNEREQGKRWQEWIDSFPSRPLLSAANSPSSASTMSESQLITSNARVLKRVSKHSKLGWSASEIQAIVQPLASKPRIGPSPNVHLSVTNDSVVSSASVTLVAA